MKLKDKIAVVTGGARGIGRAIVERYVAEGARVAVADVLVDEAAAVARNLGDAAIAVELDVTRQASIDRMVDTVVDRFGSIDILVNNAAIFDLAPILEIEAASYDKIFAVNVKGLLFTLQAVARRMVEQGRGGKIINMASQAGRRGEALVGVYCASKAAVISLTQSAGPGIDRNTVSTSTASRPASSIRRCGTMSMRCSPATKTGHWARRSVWSVRPFHAGVWDCPRITPGRRCFWRRPTATMWSPRRSTSTAGSG